MSDDLLFAHLPADGIGEKANVVFCSIVIKGIRAFYVTSTSTKLVLCDILKISKNI